MATTTPTVTRTQRIDRRAAQSLRRLGEAFEPAARQSGRLDLEWLQPVSTGPTTAVERLHRRARTQLADNAHADAVVALAKGSMRPVIVFRDHLASRAGQIDRTMAKALAVADFLVNHQAVATEELAQLPSTQKPALADLELDVNLPEFDVVLPVFSTEAAEGPARTLTGEERAALAATYGNSLDPDHILMTPYLGFGNRPFTLTLEAPLFTGVVAELLTGAPLYVSFINMGAAVFENGGQTRRGTFVHEAAHVWQAEHHVNHTAYERNSVLSQAAATLFGGSAYHYKRNKPFRTYGAEQLANQVDSALSASANPFELSIRDEMAAVGPHERYGPLFLALLGIQFEIPGKPGVVG